MINNTNGDNANGDNAPEFVIKRTGNKKSTKRIACADTNHIKGPKANLGMGYGKSVHGIISCAIPGELYKQVAVLAKQEKVNISDFVRRGLIREVGATLLCRSMNLGTDVYGVLAHAKPDKPAKKAKAAVDRLTRSEAKKAVALLNKALRGL